MMKRVLLTTDTLGGVFTYAITLARELAARGTEVHLATMGAPLRVEQRAAASAVPGLVTHESRYALEWMDDPWGGVAAAGEWLRAIASMVRPDIVHLNGYAHGALDFGAPKLVAAHSCVLSWWEAVFGEPAPSRCDEYRRRVATGLRGAQVVVACSNAMLAALQRHYGPLPSSRVVWNGAPRPRRTSVTKAPFVFSCGRAWDQAKNVDALARVAKRLAWPIKIAGWEATGRGGVESLGWLGPREISRWMERASIFALPARYEPFGLSALEAAQRGAALVLGDIPSQREIWGDAALYVSPSSDDDLTSTLTRLIDDPRLRVEMSRRARARAARFTSRRMANELLDAYASATRAPAEALCG